jgi:hypothetical protein
MRHRRVHAAAWEKHMFVLDVPDNATDLVLNVGLAGAGTSG